ncbi:LUD domain-containing protein [Psychroflexus sp. CAK57W]|uniref:LUD domain-containing protein n=1 Tax=Psychroflexus curvus TaxID=2873595 RepID=UPI001CCD0CDA|nr:LUD domain-containing protein [Psychroflexus curvus]MBZ9627684.1 LUD domain-containing protein [Psychroflexus curvus]MBZ9786171.1 LUD domain-containing protein [Psychroflexus curvus]
MNFLKRLLGIDTNEVTDEYGNEIGKFMPKPETPVDEEFVHNFKKNGGKFLYCENENELRLNFSEILKENNWSNSEVYCSESKLCEDFAHTQLTFTKNLNACFFLSSCEFLISNTGAILVSSSQMGDKKHSDLPVNFVIVAKTSQLIKTIGEGLQQINKRQGGKFPTNITTIKSFDENKDSDFMSYGSTPKNLYLLLLEDL